MIGHPRLIAAALLAMLAACANPDETGLPYPLLSHDSGSVSGVWDDPHGLTLTIDLSIGTFAVRRGCTMTGGTLRRESGNAYRIGRYESGFSDDRCGKWSAGPAIAPLDGEVVTIERTGQQLSVTGATQSLLLKRRTSR